MDTVATSNMDYSIHGGEEPKKQSFMTRLGYMCGQSPVNGMIAVLFVLFVIFLIYQSVVYYTSNKRDKDHTKDIPSCIQTIIHAQCSKKGGCGSGCPFVESDDPRVVIKNTSEMITSASADLNDTFKKVNEQIKISIEKISSKEAKQNVVNDFTVIQSSMKRCVQNVSRLSVVSQLLDNKFSKMSDTNVQVLNTRTNADTLKAALSMNMHAFTSAVAAIDASLMYNTILSISVADQPRIHDFETKLTFCKLQYVAINAEHTKIMEAIADTPEVKDSYEFIISQIQTDENLVSQSVNEYLAYMITAAKDVTEKFETLKSHVNALGSEYKQMNSKVESFNNNISGEKIGSSDISDLINDGDYSTALIKTALEPEIVTNHKKFATERATFDSGGGVPSVRDDDNDLVKWVGLFGRPTYRKSNGKSAEESSEPLRSIPSDNPSDLMRTSAPRLSFS